MQNMAMSLGGEGGGGGGRLGRVYSGVTPFLNCLHENQYSLCYIILKQHLNNFKCLLRLISIIT